MRPFRVRLAALAFLSLCGATAAWAAEVPARLAALRGVESGLWQVDAAGEPGQRVCVADPAALLQLNHGGLSCSRSVIADGGRVATVRYSCPGAGWGRTTIRIDTPRTARIDTQGIMNNAPFAWTGVGHHIGHCGGGRSRGMVDHASMRSR